MTPIKAAADPSREALKPCPFCGGTNIKALAHLDWVACDDCGAALEDAEPSARELWNTRAAPAGNAGVREALVKAREEIVIAIAFLGRDASTSRLDLTVNSLITRLANADHDILAALALPQPREAEPVTPITNPLVLPAGIKAGDYASQSPIPEAPVGREETADALVRKLRHRDGEYLHYDLSHDEAVEEVLRALKPQDGGESGS